MPHSNRRKKPQRTKRTEIVGEDGWTRVTTTNTSQRRPRPLLVQGALEKRYNEKEANCEIIWPEITLREDMTIEKIEKQYKTIEDKWLASESCKALSDCLHHDVEKAVLEQVNKCFVFGTGSFSGMIRGWIDRSHVTMYQLAAFMFITDTIESITGKRPAAFAQEPVYLELDIQFLSRLNVTTLSTPEGFKAVSTGCFVYTPNAELEVTLRTLAANPALAMMSGALDMYWRNEKGEACTNAMLMNTRDTFIDTTEEENKEKEEDQEDQEESISAPESDDLKMLHELTKEERNKHCSYVTDLEDQIEEGLQVCEQFKKGKQVRKLPNSDAKDEPFYSVHLYYHEAGVENEVGETKTGDL